MADEEKSLSLIESLRAYQETQETLNTVVSSASKALGPDWMSLLPDALDQAPMDEQERPLLKDKANHAIHYYGALAAWEEAYQYINAPHSVDRMMILERIPTLEYWLALFGDEGVNVLNQVKSLVNVQDTPQTPAEETKAEESSQEVEEQSVVPEHVETAEEANVVEEVPSLEDEPIVDIYAQKNDIEGPAPIPTTDTNNDGQIDVNDVSEDQLKQMEKQVFDNAPQADVEPVAEPLSEEKIETTTDETFVEKTVEQTPAETTEEPVAVNETPVAEEVPEEPIADGQTPTEEAVIETAPVEETLASVEETLPIVEETEEAVPVETEEVATQEVVTEEMPAETVAETDVVSDEPPDEVAETQESVLEETSLRTDLISEDEPLFQENLPEAETETVAPLPMDDNETPTEISSEAEKTESAEADESAQEVAFTKAPSIPSKSQNANFDENILAILSKEQPKNLENDPNTHIPLTRSWEITNLLNKKTLYENGVNWVSAFCVRHDNANKEEYPYYGMIVDVMVDLKETIQSVLDNQLLDEIVDQEYEGGRAALERFKESIEVELAGLPDNLKPENRVENQLDAKEILGDLDTSDDKVVVEAAPDGFELMEDPFETSAEQIISDFEKAEAASEGNLDNLNVLSKNQKTAKDKKNEKK